MFHRNGKGFQMFKLQVRIVSKTTGRPAGWKDMVSFGGVRKFATVSDAHAYACSLEQDGLFDAANYRVVPA